MVAAPSVFRAGVEEAVSVTIFNPVKETTVQVQLVVKGETVARAHGTVLGRLGWHLMGRNQEGALKKEGVAKEQTVETVHIKIFALGSVYSKSSDFWRVLPQSKGKCPDDMSLTLIIINTHNPVIKKCYPL